MAVLRYLSSIPILLFCLVFTASSSSSQSPKIIPVGTEFEINSYTTGSQQRPSASSDGQGGFIVVWDSSESYGSDSSSFSIQSQRFDSMGNPSGNQYQVNTLTTSNQVGPHVVPLPSGQFMVVWDSQTSGGSDSSYRSVQARLLDSDGIPSGTEQQINTYTTGYQIWPRISSDGADGFVVVWTSEGSSGSDSWYSSVQGQRLNSGGIPVGTEFQINTYTTLEQFLPTVAGIGHGEFVVTWYSEGSFGSDSSSRSIQGQRFNSTGTKLGEQFQVNSYTTGSQINPFVHSDGRDGFLVIWMGPSDQDNDLRGIVSQRFDAKGIKLGGEIQINSLTTGTQGGPSLVPDGRGGFLAAWPSNVSAGTDDDHSSIQARYFSLEGTASAPEFQVNTYTTSSSNLLTLTQHQNGEFVVLWTSAGSYGADNDAGSILAQRFSATIFKDGFEAGDTSEWSKTQP